MFGLCTDPQPGVQPITLFRLVCVGCALARTHQLRVFTQRYREQVRCRCCPWLCTWDELLISAATYSSAIFIFLYVLAHGHDSNVGREFHKASTKAISCGSVHLTAKIPATLRDPRSTISIIVLLQLIRDFF